MTKFLTFINDNYSFIIILIVSTFILKNVIKHYFELKMAQNFQKNKIFICLENSSSKKTIEFHSNEINLSKINEQIQILEKENSVVLLDKKAS